LSILCFPHTDLCAISYAGIQISTFPLTGRTHPFLLANNQVVFRKLDLLALPYRRDTGFRLVIIIQVISTASMEFLDSPVVVVINPCGAGHAFNYERALDLSIKGH
jgi:hypothetical protein